MTDQSTPSERPAPVEGPIGFKFTVSLSDAEYRHLAAHVKRLVALEPAPDSPAGCALQLLAFVVDKYEQIRFNPSFGLPAPSPETGEPTGENMVG